MVYILEDKQENRRQALREVVRFCGNVQAYSERLGVGRARVSNWVNQDINIPYEHAIVTEDFSKISIERLSPFTERANRVIKRLRSENKLIPVELSIKDILVGSPNSQMRLTQNRPIIVDPQGMLIFGLEQLKAHMAAGRQKILAIVLDLG